jgi:hypothetical protein
VPLLAGGAVALILGIAGGLQRLGWDVVDSGASLAELHGPLMVCGFFGTVIALERAVAFGRRWAFLSPLAAAIATLAAFAGLPVVYAQAGWIAAGLGMLAASGWIAIRHRAHFTFLLALAAACWPIGVGAWLVGASTGAVVLWWLAFLVLTIAAERLELNRVLRPTAFSRRIFWVPVAALPLAAALAAADDAGAWRLAGAALLGLAAWLGRNDVARRTIRLAGLPRFAAACLLSGYAWLAIGGAVMLILPLAQDRLAYDAALHAVFLGFVFAMVFGHAPIILPAVTGVPVGFGTLLYGPLALLHLSVAMRVAGDLLAAWSLRSWSGPAAAAAIAWFIASIVALVIRDRGRRSRRVCARTKTGRTAGASLAP